MSTPMFSLVRGWAERVQITGEPIVVKISYGSDPAKAHKEARKITQSFNALRAQTRAQVRRVQKNEMFPGPFDDVMCAIGEEKGLRFTVTFEPFDAKKIEEMFEVEVG